MISNFVHLHLHSEYSLVDGLVRIESLVHAVAAAGMPAVAVTDQCNLFAMVKFYRAAQAAGVKPIVGAELWLRDARVQALSRLVLLCQNESGYRNLVQLITRSYLHGNERGQAVVDKAWLEECSAGLIALSGGRQGDVGQALTAHNEGRARELLQHWSTLFPQRYYLEIMRTGRDGDEDHVHAAADLASEFDVPLLATNDVRFLAAEDFEAHEARVCIHNGQVLGDSRRPRIYSEQQYLRNAQEMTELFADLPAALENSLQIARRCNLELHFDRTILPAFTVAQNTNTGEYLCQQARLGLKRRLERGAIDTSAAPLERYQARLEQELDVIQQMGFADYFLVVADFIHWAGANEVPVGPGRGSGAGSLVAYALQITDIDPLRYDLLFERFLNPERVSLPDFDIDFCMDGRDRVIDYVAERYGRDRVAQIITYGSLAAKAVIRDVGRVLGQPYGFVDRIAKLIPFELGITLEKALAQEPELQRLYEQDEEVRTLIDLARPLEGLARNAGKHAGGVVIAPCPLTDYMPLYRESDTASLVTQFDKDDIEALGLVKFDFLGLRTLTIIAAAVRTINEQHTAEDKPPVDITTLSLNDAPTYALLKRCATTAVFQLESRGIKDLIKRLQPDCFDEIIALVALFRPGPLQSGMVDDFIARKHGRAEIHYPHPLLEPILRPTYGVIVYQEQVMQIAQVLAGYSLGEADLLRRAMGKKKPEEMAKQRAVFVGGAKTRGVAEERAAAIFDLMEKFAGYGFNKSHSVAYALIAYQTAWLKTHHTAAYMAAVLSADMDHTEKVVTLIDECRALDLQVLAPDINSSNYVFTAADKRAIRYGLGAIKGIGFAAIEGLCAERSAHGPFRDLFDLCRRVDTRKVNRRVLESLIRAGALDSWGAGRASLMATLPTAIQLAEQHARDRTTGQVDLFGLAPMLHDEPRLGTVALGVMFDCPDWDETERLAGEKETLGLYLSGHPITRYEDELRHIVSGRIADLTSASGDSLMPAYYGRNGREQTVVTVAGLVVALRSVQNQRGGRTAFITLDDRSARLDVAVFAEDYQRYRPLIGKDKLLIVEGTLSVDDYNGGYRMSAVGILTIDEARETHARAVLIHLHEQRAGNDYISTLAQTLQPFRPGRCPIKIAYQSSQAGAELMLGQEWCVHPTDELLLRLKKLSGEACVRMIYS